MISPPAAETLLPLAQILLDCVVETLAIGGLPVRRAGLVPGRDVAWDDCCGDASGEGQAWVALGEIRPQPSPNAGATQSCSWEYAADLLIGVMRCVPSLGQNGEIPAAGDLDDAASKLFRDASLVRSAILCCWVERARLDRGDWEIGRYTPLGPQGACAGGQTLVTVRFSDCGCQ